jgi:N6-adenosine-specific RNA methylase IME4
VSDAKKIAAEAPDLLNGIREGALTITDAKRELKERKREVVREQNRMLVEATPPAVVKAAEARYQTVVLDPPWDWGDEGDVDQFGRARPVYNTMSIHEIATLPVGDLSTDNAHIYLWITNRSLPKGFALLEAWGFRYVTAITWGKPHFGMGNYFRGQTEHVLFGVRGSLPLLRNNAGTLLLAPRSGRHSAKPDEFYQLVETCSPGPWLEMFARSERNGWASWGAEVPA